MGGRGMKIESLAIPDVKLLTPRTFRDDRGSFTETWNEQAWAAAGLTGRFVQDNHAWSRAKGTLRGLHFQKPPTAQDKLVRAIRGSVLDVAVDIRHGSPTFGQHVSAVLSAENGVQIWVPKGFAHGYVTLEPDAEVVYKVTDYYSPADDAGIQWDDPALGIDWGVTRASAVVSDKDGQLPPLSSLAPVF
ncbi:MAG: dTDP-4-dehydrorhamnose 3,5-epimerase [Hyphomicrobium sp.]